MSSAVVTGKGQVTIPLQIRRKLNLSKGARIEFVDMGDDRFALIPASQDVRSLKGIVPPPAQPISIEEMNQTIVQRAASQS